MLGICRVHDRECFDDSHFANAERIAACVNACAGITTDYLVRAKPLAQQLDEKTAAENARDRLAAEVEQMRISGSPREVLELRRIRDELVEACKDLVDLAECEGWIHLAIVKTRAAITKAEAT